MSTEGTTATEYTNILTKGLQSSLDSTAIEDGKLRYTTDTGCLYLDVVDGSESKRVKFSDIVSDLTEEQIFALLTPLPKIYVSSDTHRAYVSTPTEWIDLAAIKLAAADVSDADRPIWFGNPTEEDVAPIYVDGLSYNTSTEELKAPNLVATTVTVNNMQITTETDEDTGYNTTYFSFV